MQAAPAWKWWMLLPLLGVVACALGTRYWYMTECADQGWRDPALVVQGDFSRAETDNLVANVADHYWFGTRAPFAKEEELTAHRAPAFPWLFGMIVAWVESPDAVMRWIHCVLGALTAGCYFLFARQAFHSVLVAAVAGLLTAVHPFWVINTAELNDGVLVSFLLALALFLGTRAYQAGGAIAGLLFGLALAALVLTRATLVPFAMLALVCFLWQCRRFPLGWFAGFLAIVGLVNGIAPWLVRNFQLYERPVPIATSTYYHLWMGNNKNATGSLLREDAMRDALPEGRGQELLDEENQAKRYHLLAQDVWSEVENEPTRTLARRLDATLYFVFGERWFKHDEFADMCDDEDNVAPIPEWLAHHRETILHATMLALLILALLGWRWSQPWRRSGRLATIAVLFIPLPYVLSHSEPLSGPRLPLDGVLLCYAAFALVSLIPGLVRRPTEADPG